MEFTQMTLDDWMSLKDALKQDILSARDKINGLQRDFVRIGYKLRQIDEKKLYENDGYKSIAEFAKAECGITGPDVTRFMKINAKYSVGGYSEELRPEFLGYGQTKLAAMLTLPDDDMQMLKPAVSRETIRELGRFNKAEPEAGVADDIKELIEKFFENNADILNELYTSEAFQTGEADKLVEIVNPSGNKTFKKGLYFLVMYEQEIKIKKFGGTPQTMTWPEFFQITRELFDQVAAGSKTWKNYFGGKDNAESGDTGDSGEDTGRTTENETDEKGETKADENTSEADSLEKGREHGVSRMAGNETGRDKQANIPTAGTSNESERKKSEKKEIVPAQKTSEILEEKGITEAKKEHHNKAVQAEETGEQEVKTELVEEQEEIDTKSDVEIVEKSFSSRKDYIDTLTAYGFAQYLTREYNEHSLQVSALAYPSELERWLTEEVDENGRSLL